MADYDDEFAQTNEAVAGSPGEGCEWTSLGDIVPGCTVYNSVQPSDLHQGSLGDCWLISAMASLAEYPDVVQGLITENGDHYTVNLYSFENGGFQGVEVNDMVPSQGGRPMFVQPTAEGEIWPCLIEKAFAKMGGGYANLSGGWPIFAFGVMKGITDLYLYTQPGDSGQYNAVSADFTEDNLKSGVNWNNEGALSMEEMWDELIVCNAADFLMCAGSNAGKDSDASGLGVAQGHAYTILDVQNGPGGSDFQLIQLRNPWGRGEWQGAWSDGAPEWDDNPDVTAALNPQDKEDGAFWMPWDAFQTEYAQIYVAKGQSARRTPAGAPPPLCACSVM